MVYQSRSRISSLFNFKCVANTWLSSHIVYKFRCSCCNEAYYGQTQKYFLWELLSIWLLHLWLVSLLKSNSWDVRLFKTSKLSLLKYRPLVTKFLFEFESEGVKFKQKSGHNSVSGDDFEIIGGDLGTSMWKENGWRIVDGAIIPSSNIWGGWWSCLIDLVLQGSLFYFLCAIARRVSNLHFGVLISGNICWWSQTCNCPVGVKGWPVYDSTTCVS